MAIELQITAMWAGALVCLLALASYVRTRDPSRGLVALAFATNVAWVLSDLVRWTHVGGLEPLFRLALFLNVTRAYVLLLLVRRVCDVRRSWFIGTGAMALALLPTLALLQRPYPEWWILTYCFAVFVPMVKVTLLFAGEARQRGGRSGTRLWMTAVGCGAFALWPLSQIVGRATGIAINVGLYAFMPMNAVGEVLMILNSAGIMLFAISFVVTFLPPRWLRHSWAASAAHEVSGRVLELPADAEPQQVWQRYAEAVAEASGGDAVAVVAGESIAVLTVRRPLPAGAAESLLLVAGSVARAEPAGGEVVAPGDVRCVPLVDSRIDGGAMAVMNRRQGLFDRDDLLAFATAAAEAAVLAERGRLLAEQRRLAAELSAALADQRRTDEMRGKFLAATSHELRTPLNAILGFSDLILSDLDQDDPHRPLMEHVHTGGRRLLHLINDLLDLSKVASGRLDLHMTPTRLDELSVDLVATLRPLWEQRQLRLINNVPMITADVDSFRFRQVLENLLSNAIKFTPVGGTVTLSGEVTVSGAALHVLDTGPGITPEDQQKVFQEFQQVGEPGSRQQGSGLGLTLARQIVEAHGASLTLSSTPGHGSVFTVTLPASSVVNLPLPGDPTAAASANTTAASRV